MFKKSAYFDDFVFLLFCSFLKIVLIFFLFFPFPSSSSWSCCATFSLLCSFSSLSFCSLGRLPSLVKDNGLASLDSGSGALVPTELFPLIVCAVLESENCFYWAFKLQESDLHRSFKSFFFSLEYYKGIKRVLGNHMCSMGRETYQMKSMLCQCSLHLNVDHSALQSGSRVAIPVRRKKMTVMMMKSINREIMILAETFF